MKSIAARFSEWVGLAALAALAPLAHAAPISATVGDFDGTYVVGTLDKNVTGISISVSGFVVGGSYTFSFELEPGTQFRPAALGLVFGDFGRDTQDVFGFSADFTPVSGTELLEFDYLGATLDEDTVAIFAGLILCTDNCTPITPIPEPGTMALVGLALAGMGLAARRRKAV